MRKIALFVTFLLFINITNIAYAAPSVQSEQGRDYIVQTDDWLSKLADKFYGDPFSWPIIQQATNLKAREDDSFAYISNPNLIEVGQKLWIPTSRVSPTALKKIEQATQDEISEQFETTNLEKRWLILDQVGTISVNGGNLSLSGGGQGHKRINSRQEFFATSTGISAKARIKLSGDYQKFGFGVNAEEFPSPTAGFYFDTYSRFDSSGGSENTTYLLVIDMPNGRTSQTFLLKEQIPVTWNEFHEFEVVWTISMVSFYIDNELKVSVPYTFDNTLPVGLWNDRGQLMQVDWVEVQEYPSVR